MRSRLCFFYIRAFRCACERTWKYRSISSNSSAQLEIKDTINKVKYRCLYIITCVSIDGGHEWFSDYSRGRQEIFVFGHSSINYDFADSRTEVLRYRSLSPTS